MLKAMQWPYSSDMQKLGRDPNNVESPTVQPLEHLSENSNELFK